MRFSESISLLWEREERRVGLRLTPNEAYVSLEKDDRLATPEEMSSHSLLVGLAASSHALCLLVEDSESASSLAVEAIIDDLRASRSTVPIISACNPFRYPSIARKADAVLANPLWDTTLLEAAIGEDQNIIGLCKDATDASDLLGIPIEGEADPVPLPEYKAILTARNWGFTDRGIYVATDDAFEVRALRRRVGDMHILVEPPPDTSPEDLAALVAAGVNRFGGGIIPILAAQELLGGRDKWGEETIPLFAHSDPAKGGLMKIWTEAVNAGLAEVGSFRQPLAA